MRVQTTTNGFNQNEEKAQDHPLSKKLAMMNSDLIDKQWIQQRRSAARGDLESSIKVDEKETHAAIINRIKSQYKTNIEAAGQEDSEDGDEEEKQKQTENTNGTQYTIADHIADHPSDEDDDDDNNEEDQDEDADMEDSHQPKPNQIRQNPNQIRPSPTVDLTENALEVHNTNQNDTQSPSNGAFAVRKRSHRKRKALQMSPVAEEPTGNPPTKKRRYNAVLQNVPSKYDHNRMNDEQKKQSKELNRLTDLQNKTYKQFIKQYEKKYDDVYIEANEEQMKKACAEPEECKRLNERWVITQEQIMSLRQELHSLLITNNTGFTSMNQTQAPLIIRPNHHEDDPKPKHSHYGARANITSPFRSTRRTH
eukprot:470695_1